MKTVFVVFTISDPKGSFVCVRRTFPKAAEEAAKVKPAMILEVPTVQSETEIVNRWELS